ncbi:hypothetical protein BUALT_Bualt11G0001900 [Buddleja alternifolia]|uniref:BZIP domain-containing protein n=1 Tax=Buddleja alternifolia TaxID=168488 RepID=A0AAV6WRZ9_9LAMI|nr:hypothetical protein BUALT_Bualt11G0001900 [Buddleja alternifolia]
MASPMSGTSSGSTSIQNSGGSEENLQQITDQRKRKRMVSNRESARRSRMRKQKHLDDLTAQVTLLRAENNHILMNVNTVAQLYLNIEYENSVLRAQMCELNHRLQSLNDIIINSSKINLVHYGDLDQMISGVDDFLNPLGLIHVNQPIMPSSDVFMY